jgi:sortase A
MTDPETDATQRWARVPALEGPPRRRHAAPEDDPTEDDPADDELADDELAEDDLAERDPHAEPAERRPRDPLWQTITRGVGELLVTAGLILLLFVVYELWVTDLLNDRRQSALADEIHEQWGEAPAPGTPIAPQVAPAVGEPLAVLHVPRLGADWSRVVLEGTEEDQLREGPGHYVGTALPGEPGNLALAGHRVGKGSPFLDADQLRPGDPIVVETADAWYVYRVLGDPATGDYATDPSGIPGQQIVKPADVSVIAPVPNSPGVAPAGAAYLTLTTCHPKYSAHQRLIVHAVLDGAPTSKADDPDGPPELQEG